MEIIIAKTIINVNNIVQKWYNMIWITFFKELALLRAGKRAATIVCLQKSEFLSVDKDDFSEIGIVNTLRTEMEERVVFLR